MKRLYTILSCLALTLLAGCANEDLGVIGGADGPTAVVVATSISTPDNSNVLWIVLLAVLLVALAVVLLRINKNHK